MSELELSDPDLILAVSVCYVGALFLFAWYVDRRAAEGGVRWLRSPIVYTLSLSVYCTTWTFYGAVGSAARSGLEFMAIYLGPTLVFIGWWWLIRKLVRIGRTQRITSIADMLSSRYGKSARIAALSTLIAITAATPYIALQLQSVTLAYEKISGSSSSLDAQIALWVAGGLAAFTILYGTRTLDENERHHGIVAVIAAEAVVKLAALMAVGWFAVYSVAGGLDDTFSLMGNTGIELDQVFGIRWVILMFLSATAIVCLPRQFQVMVVENSNDRQIAVASWLFPAYLLLTSLFILPIAAVGAGVLPAGENPDLYVLTLPLLSGREDLAIFIFIGGLSAATSMVVVSVTALATMVSNHIVAPFLLFASARQGFDAPDDLRRILLSVRQVTIVGILALGYVYFLIAGRSEELATTGLIAFCGVAQFLPALVAAITWRNATRAGALSGLVVGFAIWLYLLYLPNLLGYPISPSIEALLLGDDNLVYTTVWSLGCNAAALVLVSLITRLSPLERLQSAIFIDVFKSRTANATGMIEREASQSELRALAERILGPSSASSLFAASGEGLSKDEAPTPSFMENFERELAGSVGAASAHAMMLQLTGAESISIGALMEIADENVNLLRMTEALEQKSLEAERNARDLQAANEKLLLLDAQKDEFLSNVGHELRTPMASVRSFSEILRDTPDLDAEKRAHFAGIIQAESLRLTRLLDEIRDLSFLSDQDAAYAIEPIEIKPVIEQAVEVVLASFSDRSIALENHGASADIWVRANQDRLSQILINLLANAVLHNDKDAIRLDIRCWRDAATYCVAISDNGPGVPEALRDQIFEPFFRQSKAGSSGLGLAIAMRIIQTFGGDLGVDDSALGGACFTVTLPIAHKPA